MSHEPGARPQPRSDWLSMVTPEGDQSERALHGGKAGVRERALPGQEEAERSRVNLFQSQNNPKKGFGQNLSLADYRPNSNIGRNNWPGR